MLTTSRAYAHEVGHVLGFHHLHAPDSLWCIPLCISQVGHVLGFHHPDAEWEINLKANVSMKDCALPSPPGPASPPPSYDPFHAPSMHLP